MKISSCFSIGGLPALSLCAGLLAAAGCTDPALQSELEDLRQKQHQSSRVISNHQSLLNTAEDDMRNMKRELLLALSAISNEFEEAVFQYESTLRLKNRRLASLEEKNRALTRQLAAFADSTPPEPPTVAQNVRPFITRRTPEYPEKPFPLSITGIQGEKIVTDTRTASRYVEEDTGEVDTFGNPIRAGGWEEQEISEYGYEVRFNAENLTDKELEMHCRAGSTSMDLMLPPQAVTNGVRLRAALGSALFIRAEYQQKSFNIPFD